MSAALVLAGIEDPAATATVTSAALVLAGIEDPAAIATVTSVDPAATVTAAIAAPVAIV